MLLLHFLVEIMIFTHTFFYSVYVKFIGHNIQVLPHASILYLLTYYVFGKQFAVYS